MGYVRRGLVGGYWPHVCAWGLGQHILTTKRCIETAHVGTTTTTTPSHYTSLSFSVSLTYSRTSNSCSRTLPFPSLSFPLPFSSPYFFHGAPLSLTSPLSASLCLLSPHPLSREWSRFLSLWPPKRLGNGPRIGACLWGAVCLFLIVRRIWSGG